MYPQDTLLIKLNDCIVGTLTRLVDESIVLAFDTSYLEDTQRPILSLSHQGAMGSFVAGRTRTATRLSTFFSNLLPEGHLLDYLAQKLGLNSSREFFLLAELGGDLPGAVSVSRVGDLSNITVSTKKIPVLDSPLRFSLAGVQLKFSAIAEARGTFTIPADGAGGSWIVKLPSERFSQVPEVEYSMLQLAQLAGIDVPEFNVVPTKQIDGIPADFRDIAANSLAVKRFDRTISGVRIHMEDFAQIYQVYPQDKYKMASYAHIGKVLWSEGGESSYCEFIRRLVFTVAIGNGDMHLKNWSVLYHDPRKPVLSPAYDFLPTISYIRNDSLALNLAGTKNFYDVTIDKFKKMAEKAKAPEKLTTRIVEEMTEKILLVWKQNRTDLNMPANVRKDIEAHMAKLLLFKRNQR